MEWKNNQKLLQREGKLPLKIRVASMIKVDQKLPFVTKNELEMRRKELE